MPALTDLLLTTFGPLPVVSQDLAGLRAIKIAGFGSWRARYRGVGCRACQRSIPALVTCTDGDQQDATFRLIAAASLHELTDEIPAALDLALPRRKWHPAGPVVAQWHSFDPKTCDIGRYLFEVDAGVFIGCYSAERSIIDVFHTRGLTGTDVAVEALKRWLRRPGSQPAQLLDLATSWPRALAPLRRALEVLL